MNSVRRRSGRSGQTMVFMVMALVILAFVLIWQFDVHKVISVKWRIQNAGDAAALAAARWQGITLNLIGDLNVMKAVALSGGDASAADAIGDMQARLCFVGPMLGVLAAQQAAKNNGVYSNSDFTAHMMEHAERDVMGPDGYAAVFAEPYPGCWEEYGTMIQTVAAEGIAAQPYNPRFYYDYTGGHMLLRADFYNAIASRAWCWFYWNARDLLENYDGYEYWDELPAIGPTQVAGNNEYYGVGVVAVGRTLAGLPHSSNVVQAIAAAGEDRGLDVTGLSNSVRAVSNTWYCYDPSVWDSRWSRLDPIPLVGTVRPEYDYAGADAAVRITASADLFSSQQGGASVNWVAAAKPFGSLQTQSGPQRPDYYGLVLPAFRDVRLVPVDAVSGAEAGFYDLAWREHIETHLPLYMQNGIYGLDDDCWFCAQLLTWEDSGFRQSGLDWIAAAEAEDEDPCSSEGPGGPGPSGGTPHGH